MESLLRKQERTAGQIIRAYENLKKVGQANITLGVVESRLAALNAKWEAFEKIDGDIDETATDDERKGAYFKQDVYGATEESYLANKGKMLDIMQQIRDRREETAARTAPITQQLPKISLPKFSGDLTEWPTFRDLYASMVRGNAALSPIEKLHYLKTSLTKEPADLIASIPLTAENYEAAWNALIDRYENVRLLTIAQQWNIFSLSPMRSESSPELRALYNGTVNAVSALRALGRPVDAYSDWLVFLTVQKLDKLTRREWELHVGAQKTPSTFAEL